MLSKKRARDLESLGVSSTLLLPETKRKTIDTLQKQYGSIEVFKRHVVESCRNTCVERYGVPSFLLRDEVKEKARLASRSKQALRRRHETMKRNGTYGTGSSKAEDTFYAHLIKVFGDENVFRHVQLYEHDVDFYVASIDTYVQFDGVYWHGLDRPLHVIAKHKSARDRSIHAAYLNDQRMNESCRQAGIQLVRFTDVEVSTSDDVFSLIKAKCRFT